MKSFVASKKSFERSEKMSDKKDINCNDILRVLNQLDEYLDRPIARDALELDKNSSTVKNKELLKRLRKSLIQYTERGKDLVYVGFMGHFSTGKSSTINSLLKLDKKSRKYRSIGLNPVDKTITLITHKKNQDSIINVTKEGLVPIRASFIENDFLDNIVIADTPGAGDPVLAAEIAKDFLPICDLIIYFFSATNPLDIADKPLLEEKFSTLYFIPIKFVVTRADEFKKDINLSFDENNYDSAKANEFLGVFTQRVNQLFKNGSINVTPEDVFLIDNKASFKIDALRNYISGFSDVSDISGQISIHLHKIRYFRSSVNSLKSFFFDFLNDKVAALSKFVDIANQNINDFNDAIQISNNSLTESWVNSFRDIEKEWSRVYNSLPDKLDLPDSLLGFNSLERTNKLSSLKESIKKKVRASVEDSIKKGNEKALDQLKSRSSSLSKLHKQVNNTNLNQIERNPDSFRIEIPEIDLKDCFRQHFEFNTFSLVSFEADNLVQDLDRQFDKACRNLRKSIFVLKGILSSQNPLSAYEEILTNSENSLAEDFDKFFNIITIYRSGVFSYNVKETIVKLGLGQKLDELENKKFSDVEKALKKQDAIETIFPGRKQILSEFKQRVVELESSNLNLESDFERFFKEKASLHKVLVNLPKRELEFIVNELTDYLNSKLRKFKYNINNEIQLSVKNTLEKWESTIMSEQKARRLYFFYFLSGSIILTTSVYLAFLKFGEVNVSNNLFSTILLGLITNCIFAFFSFLVAKAYDRFPRRINSSESAILAEFREDFERIRDDNISFLEYNSLNEGGKKIEYISNYLFHYLENNLIHTPLNEWSQSAKSYFEILVDLNNRYYQIREKYVKLIEKLKGEVSQYFDRINDNLEKLRDFSNDLKQNSVDPSFELLASTRDTLKEVKGKIEAIKFFE